MTCARVGTGIMAGHDTRISTKNSDKVAARWLFFFFSSRRRHTRFDCDWSSDVCSSDLFVQKRLDAEQLGLVSILGQAEVGQNDHLRSMSGAGERAQHPEARTGAQVQIE